MAYNPRAQLSIAVLESHPDCTYFLLNEKTALKRLHSYDYARLLPLQHKQLANYSGTPLSHTPRGIYLSFENSCHFAEVLVTITELRCRQK